MPDLVRTDRVLVEDIGALSATDFGLAGNVSFLNHHFIDPKGRTVRVRSFYKLMPGEVHHRNVRTKPDEAPRRPGGEDGDGRHRHFWEKILVDVELPLPGSGQDPTEPISGHVRYHPEGAWYGPFDKFRKRVGADDRVTVHCHIHTEGSAYRPLQTINSMQEHMVKLRHQRNDPWGDGWYFGFDGERQDDENPSQAATWESWQQKRIGFNEPPISDELIKLNINAFPWYPHKLPGVKIKPIAAFNAQGPITSLIRMEPGASLPARLLRDHRILSVLAGEITMGGNQVLKDRMMAFGSPGDELPPITANEPSLLWLVRWMWKDNPVADLWLD